MQIVKERKRILLVPQIHVKIALNVVKAWNLVQMKLLSWRSKIEFGAIRTVLTFRLYANMAASNTGIPLKEKNPRELFACVKRTHKN